jgi:hypothetical protein
MHHHEAHPVYYLGERNPTGWLRTIQLGEPNRWRPGAGGTASSVKHAPRPIRRCPASGLKKQGSASSLAFQWHIVHLPNLISLALAAGCNRMQLAQLHSLTTQPSDQIYTRHETLLMLLHFEMQNSADLCCQRAHVGGPRATTACSCDVAIPIMLFLPHLTAQEVHSPTTSGAHSNTS